MTADFTVHAAIDNSWNLHLRKNKTYTYTHWSSFSGSSTLDSGTYMIRCHKIILLSASENPSRKYLNDSYYFEEVKLKKHQSFEYLHLSKDKRFSFFGNKYLVLTNLPFDYSKIVSAKPEDKIGVDTIPTNSSQIEFIKVNRLPKYYIDTTEMTKCDTCWTVIYQSDLLTVINIDNKDEVYYNAFITGNIIYDVNFDIYMALQEYILGRLKKEKVITKEQKLDILELLEKQLDERKQWQNQGRPPRWTP